MLRRLRAPALVRSLTVVVLAGSATCCAPPPLSAAGAHVALVERPGSTCALVSSLQGSAGYNGRSRETNAADIEAYLRNQAADRGADTLVVRSRRDGARSEGESLSQPRGAMSSGGCPNCVSITAEAYRCAVATTAKADAPRPSPASPSGPPPAASSEPAFADTAAEAAMSAAMGSARSCRRSDDPIGEAQVTVTFAATGDVVYAEVSAGPFAGTATGECIARKFRNARVPPFAGAARSITATVRLGT